MIQKLKSQFYLGNNHFMIYVGIKHINIYYTKQRYNDKMKLDIIYKFI